MGILDETSERLQKEKVQEDEKRKRNQRDYDSEQDRLNKRALEFKKKLNLGKPFAVYVEKNELKIKKGKELLVTIKFSTDSLAQYVGDGEYIGQGPSFDSDRICYTKSFKPKNSQHICANEWEEFFHYEDSDGLKFLGEFLLKESKS